MWFKGIHGVLDVITGVVLLAVPRLLPSAVLWAAAEAGDLGVAGAVLSGALHNVGADLLNWPGWLLGVFLLVHGIVKLASAVCLLRRITRGYPWALGALAALLVYQVIDAVMTMSLTIAALAVIDLAVIALVISEYRQLRSDDRKRAEPNLAGGPGPGPGEAELAETAAVVTASAAG